MPQIRFGGGWWIFFCSHTTLKDQLSILLRRLRNQHRGTSSFARRQPPIQPVLDALISTPYCMHVYCTAFFEKIKYIFIDCRNCRLFDGGAGSGRPAVYLHSRYTNCSLSTKKQLCHAELLFSISFQIQSQRGNHSSKNRPLRHRGQVLSEPQVLLPPAAAAAGTHLPAPRPLPPGAFRPM